MPITQQQFQASADRLNVDVNTVKAVAKVESSRGGFDAQGRLTILFEPHIFWKYLWRENIDPRDIKQTDPNLVNPIWDKTLYGKYSDQWDKLLRAREISEDAANLSASFGAFQIMGFNFKMCGFNSAKSYISFLEKSEHNQLEAFCNYLTKVQLVDELRLLDWRGFAHGYNGKYYWKNQYDLKLKAAYEKFKANPGLLF